MNEQQREALRQLFNRGYDSPLQAGIAVSKVVGSAVIPTKEIVWFEDGQIMKIARIEKIKGKFKWVEGKISH